MSATIKVTADQQKTIQRRVAGRAAAGDVAELLGDLLTDRDYARAFVEELWKRYQDPPEVIAADTAPPIARLGRTVMAFGEHKGKPFDEVPLKYLDWLCREQEGFYSSLRAYLKHPDLQSRRGESL